MPIPCKRLNNRFFAHDAAEVAKALLGKVIRVRYQHLILSAQITETEAYYLHEKASHASLGFTEKRKALFMPAGTIYMYYSRAGDSLNISCEGPGNAVLIKAGIPFLDNLAENESIIKKMHALNPPKNGLGIRPIAQLCNGQALLCRSLGLKVADWDQKTFNDNFYLEDIGYHATKILCTPRLGIPPGRDEHLLLRFVDTSLHPKPKIPKLKLGNGH